MGQRNPPTYQQVPVISKAGAGLEPATQEVQPPHTLAV